MKKYALILSLVLAVILATATAFLSCSAYNLHAKEGGDDDIFDDDSSGDDDSAGDDDGAADDDSDHVNVNVPADRWVDSAFDVPQGKELDVTATGTVTIDGKTSDPGGIAGSKCGTGCVFKNAARGLLIGSIQGRAFQLGKSYARVPAEFGRLKLLINDTFAHDVSGSYAVAIKATSAAEDEGDALDSILGGEKAPQVGDAWMNSGLSVQQGGGISVSASGTVNVDADTSTGPDGVGSACPGCPLPTAPRGALIGKVCCPSGDELFLIGSNYAQTATRSGLLFLIVNDNSIDDNSGHFAVDATFYPK